MVLVELRRRADPGPPAPRQRALVDAGEPERARVGNAQPGDDRAERRLAAPDGPSSSRRSPRRISSVQSDSTGSVRPG
jgi:hypothetical protein